MSAPAAVEWIAGPGASFEAALLAGRGVRTAAIAAGARLPPKDLSRFYPSTMQDAVAAVHARAEDNKKKAAQSKQKSKSKSSAPLTPSDSHFPGAKAGGGEPSAFWMYIEDYFRDFTQEDLRGLLPLLLDPRDDPVLRVPPCGRRLEDEREQQRRHAAAKAAADAARAAALAACTRGGSEWDTGAGDPSRQHSGMDGSPEAERRSSRLVSRHSKEEEARRQEQLEAQAAEAAVVAEQAEAAAAAAAARAMAVVPLTPSGQPARQLLGVLPEQRLALLLHQLTELLRLSGEAPLAPGPSPSLAASLRHLAATAGSAPAGSGSELGEAARVEVEDWLRQQLEPLADRLGCHLRVLPPWAARLRRVRCAAAATAEPGRGPGASAVGGGEGERQEGGGGAADLPAAQLATAGYLHPYTELMLGLPVQPHTVAAAVEVPAPEVLSAARQPTLGREESAAAAAPEDSTASLAATPAASLLAATPGSAMLLAEAPSTASLPALSEQRSRDGGAAAAGADTAATAHTAALPVAAAGAGDAAAGIVSGAATPAGGPLAAASGDEGAATGGGGGQQSRGGGRARGISNYALLAGKKSSSRSTAPPKKAARAAAARPEADAGLQHPVARAVAALVAAGEADAPAVEQWRRGLDRCPALLAAAPEDEVLAEMLALQNELMQQAAANRARLAPALAGMLGEISQRATAAELRGREEEEVKAWVQKTLEVKRQQQRQRREQAHAEALAAKRQSIMASPRPVLGRQRGHLMEVGEEEGEDPLQLAYSLGPEELYDVLAKRAPPNEDRCAVCAEADWTPTNQIVYCERCDVAVHQLCYGIAAVPEGDWLCDPCREHEGALRAQGKSETEIRPPGHQQRGDLLEGGAHACRCVLCPIKYGAFKRSEDGRHWVHSACALWVPETFLAVREVPGVGVQGYVGGLERVKQERHDGQCAVCGLAGAGAVVACQQPGGCPVAFHVLCARNIGLHLPIRADPSRKGALQYRIYCAQHSAAQRQRDDQAAQERRSRAAAAQQKESRARAAERLAAERAALAAQEEERAVLFSLRANMEVSRMLSDLTKRRERLKKQLAVLQRKEWEQLRGADPERALAWAQQARRRRQLAASAAAAPVVPPLHPPAPEDAAGAAPLGPPLGLQQLPPFALPVAKPAQQAQQAQQQQQQQVQAMFAQGGAGALPFMQQLQLPPAQQAPPLLVPQPPSFALDMFAAQPQQQQQQQQHPQQFFQQQYQQQYQQQQFQQQQYQLQRQAAASSAGFAFPDLPLPLPAQQQQQQAGAAASLPPSSAQELPAAAGLLLNVPASAAAAAQVPSDVAAAMFGAHAATPPGMVPGMPSQAAHSAGAAARPTAQHAQRAVAPAAPVGRADSGAAAAMMQGRPGVQPGTGPPRLDLATQQLQVPAATPPPSSPLASAAAPSGSGRPKRAAAAALQPGGAKRLRSGSAETTPAGTPRAAQPAPHAAAAAAPAFPPPQPPSVEVVGGAAAAAGRRQRVASIKVRENLLQRERQMTAEEAEALNARLPGPLRYLPAEELEAALGSPSARGGPRGVAQQQQRQAKAARGRGGGYSGR